MLKNTFLPHSDAQFQLAGRRQHIYSLYQLHGSNSDALSYWLIIQFTFINEHVSVYATDIIVSFVL